MPTNDLQGFARVRDVRAGLIITTSIFSVYPVYFLLHMVTKYVTILYTPPTPRRNPEEFHPDFIGLYGSGHAPTAGANF